jgi:hypothetical protein
VITPDTSIAGTAYTGVASPTFTLAEDLPPASNAKQWVVSALGGTQTGVTANSISSPFTVSWWKPASLRSLPPANTLTGLRGSIPNNQSKLIVRKGGNAASGVPVIAVFRGTWDIPAGMDSYEPQQVLAMQSFIEGLLVEEAGQIGQSLITGT